MTRFQPATHLPYECTIHTLQMQGDHGRAYHVMLDLIRGDKNPSWNISTDRTALRAMVLDAETGRVVAAKFVEEPRAEFVRNHGQLDIMDESGRIQFRSASETDGAIDFALQAAILPSTLVQDVSDSLKAALEKALASLSSGQQALLRDALVLQLGVTDYPRTLHTGTLTVKRQGGQPLTLTARDTPSTFSHHYGNSLTEYVFLASVPQAGEPSFIAVVARELIDLDKSKPGGEFALPAGYLIRTDAQVESSFALLAPSAEKKGSDELNLGSALLGSKLEVQTRVDVGQVLLNDGQLLAKTGFGSVSISSEYLLEQIGLAEPVSFPNVVIDVTGRFVEQA
jgi:hypothetical protein